MGTHEDPGRRAVFAGGSPGLGGSDHDPCRGRGMRSGEEGVHSLKERRNRPVSLLELDCHSHHDIPFTAAPPWYPNELCGGCGAPDWATEAGC